MKLEIEGSLTLEEIRELRKIPYGRCVNEKRGAAYVGARSSSRGNSIIDNPFEKCKRGGKLWYQQAH